MGVSSAVGLLLSVEPCEMEWPPPQHHAVAVQLLSRSVAGYL